MHGNQGYRHTLRIRFFTATVVTRTRLNLTFTRTLPLMSLLSSTLIHCKSLPSFTSVMNIERCTWVTIRVP